MIEKSTLLDKHRLLEIMRPTITRSGWAVHNLHYTKPWVVAPYGVTPHTYQQWSDTILYMGGSVGWRLIDFTDCQQRQLTLFLDNRSAPITLPVLDMVIVELHRPPKQTSREAIRMIQVDTTPVGKRVITYQVARLTIAS